MNAGRTGAGAAGSPASRADPQPRPHARRCCCTPCCSAPGPGSSACPTTPSRSCSGSGWAPSPGTSRPSRASTSSSPRDWWPPVLALVVYFYSRGVADNLHRGDISVMMPIDADRWLFGGHLPTEVLQHALVRQPVRPGERPAVVRPVLHHRLRLPLRHRADHRGRAVGAQPARVRAVDAPARRDQLRRARHLHRLPDGAAVVGLPGRLHRRRPAADHRPRLGGHRHRPAQPPARRGRQQGRGHAVAAPGHRVPGGGVRHHPAASVVALAAGPLPRGHGRLAGLQRRALRHRRARRVVGSGAGAGRLLPGGSGSAAAPSRRPGGRRECLVETEVSPRSASPRG